MRNNDSINDHLKEVELIKDNGEFYLKPSSESYQFYPTAIIPYRLFEMYLNYRDAKNRINRYFKKVKDKPMHVAKNHISEGEVHRFNDDGSITIIT